MQGKHVAAIAGSVVAMVLVGSVAAQQVERVLVEQARQQRGIQQVQAEVERLDDQTRGMLQDYLDLAEETDGLTGYNAQLRRMLERQQGELASFETQLGDVEELRRRLYPSLVQMVDVLGQLVEVDAPFLPRERQARVATLRAMLDEPGTPPAEKLRRVLEAYQVEMEYAHTIEAYEGELVRDDGSRTVSFLRFGRVGLYYLTLDGGELGYWDSAQRQWQPLQRSLRTELERGLRIARKQLPPNLISLPVPAPSVGAIQLPAELP